MAESSKELKKPLVKKVCELRPLDSGLTLTVKVVDTKMVAPKGRQARTAESLVGDETGIIVLLLGMIKGNIFIFFSFLLWCSSNSTFSPVEDDFLFSFVEYHTMFKRVKHRFLGT